MDPSMPADPSALGLDLDLVLHPVHAVNGGGELLCLVGKCFGRHSAAQRHDSGRRFHLDAGAPQATVELKPARDFHRDALVTLTCLGIFGPFAT